MQGLLKKEAGEQMPTEQMPPAEEAEADESNPIFQAALALLGKALYQGGAADKVIKSISTAQNLTQGLADTAYNMMEIIDERTNSQVPDELLVLLASQVLTEVAGIAETGGVAVKPQDIGEAMKMMILRFVGEQGHDVSQLQQAMDQVDPAVFEQAANEPMPGEMEAQQQ